MAPPKLHCFKGLTRPQSRQKLLIGVLVEASDFSRAHGEAVRLFDANRNRALALVHARFARYTGAKAHVVIERFRFER